jgi:hypothetical protein
MNKKDIENIKKVLGKYVELYKYRDIFKKEYFGIEDSTVLKLIEELNKTEDLSPKKTNRSKDANKIKDKKISDVKKVSNILDIKTEEDVEKIYIKSLNSKDENNSLMKYKVVELKEMYKILYGESGLKSGATKKIIIGHINRYFEFKKRTDSMKL